MSFMLYDRREISRQLKKLEKESEYGWKDILIVLWWLLNDR